MSQTLRTFFKIEPGEGTAVGLSLIQSVLLGIPRLFTLTVGGAVFLDRYSADNLPLVYIAASVVLPAVGFLHLYLGRRLSFLRLQLGTLALLSVVTGAFLLLLQFSDARWPAFALFVWCGAELHLSNIVLWSTANRVFTVRQGKRLFGLIGSGEIISAIIGGALTPLLIGILGTSQLLALSLIGFLLAFLNLVSMARFYRARAGKEPAERTGDRSRRPDSFAALFKSRYLGLIFLSSALILSAGFFVNNIFYFQLGQTFSSAAQLAGFMGQFFAAYSLLSLVFRSVLSGRMLLRFGLLGGLVSTPCAVFVGAACVVAAGWSGAGVQLVLWSVVAMRLVERLFMGSFGQPAYYTLFQPLSRDRRTQVQTTADTILGPIAGGVTGLVLLFLNKFLALTSVGLSVALLPVLIVWAVASVAASRGFQDALTAALSRRGISGSDLTVSDPTSLHILERGLESHRPLEVLYCLRLLESAEHPRYRQLLLGLMDHADPVVRRGVYQAIERTADQASLPVLLARLASEEDGDARAALLRAAGAAGGQEARASIEPHLDDPDETARGGALVALIRYCGTAAGDRAARDLEGLVAAASPSRRVLAAKVLSDLGASRPEGALSALLEDGDAEVRRAAVLAVGEAASPEVWRLVIANLEVSAVRPDALRALLQAGPAALQALEQAYRAETSSPSLRSLILQVLGRSGSQEATRLLLDQLRIEHRGLLSEALWSLHLCGYQAAGADRDLVEGCLHRELEHGDQVIAAWRDLAREPGAELLSSALTQELERTRKRAFLLLSFIYDAESLMKILSNFGGPPALRDLALELFEAKVDARHATVTLPLLVGRSSQEPASARERARQVLFAESFWTSPWIRACAVDAVSSRAGQLTAAQQEQIRSDPDPLVRETARYRLDPKAAGGEAPLDDRLPTIERVRILRGVSIFREIDDEVLAELAPQLEEVHVGPGEEVFHAGDVGSSMYIVSRGSLRLHTGGDTISELHAGDIFGELSALEAEARTESAIALEPSHLFRLHDSHLHAFMATRIEVVRGIIRVLCHLVRTAPTDKLAGKAREEQELAAAEQMPVSLYGADYLSSLEKVLILKTAQIFSEVADEILTEVAERAQEVRLKKNEVLFHKGDPGTTTYIVAAGRIRIHIGERWIADATERAVVGELAALSSEPRTASVTAAEDSLLLALDQESLFELMWDRHDIVRGIIRVLVMRLRRLRRAAQG